ncbi:MAG: ATP-binding protein [Polyangiales bacterium]
MDDRGRVDDSDESDELLRIAHVLVDGKQLLLESWTARVLADPMVPEASRLSEPVLHDHVPALVDRLADALGRHVDTGGSAEAAGRNAGHANEARAHAASRFRAGYTMTAVLREVSHFRAALLELCDANGISLGGRAAALVQAAIDEVMAIAAVEIDGTAKREMETEKQWLRRVVELMPVSVRLSDAEGRLLEENAAAKDLWANVPMTQHPTALARALQEGTSIGPEETEIVEENGTKHTVLVSAAPVCDEHGAVVGGVAVHVDITAQKQNEVGLRAAIAERDVYIEELRSKEAELHTLADTMPILAWYADPDGQLRWYNRRWYEYTGTAPGEDTARPYHPDDAERVRRRWMAAVETGEPWQDEFRLRGADGNYRWFLSRAMPLRDARGRIERWFGTHVDVDDQKQAAEDLRITAVFRERFIGILGHDLRTPLSSIAMAASLLMRHERLPEAELRIVQRIANSTNRMTRMVEDLLDFARARQGGGIPVSPQPMELAEVCRAVVEEIEIAHPGRHIDVHVQGGSTGEWDRDRIAQVVMNLLNNAFDHGASDAPVTLDVTGTDFERVSFTVTNLGTPIPPEMVENLFDPFKRGEKEGARKGKGLGLGLHIASAIVRAHGGHIVVSSDPKARTVSFRIELPRHPPALDPTPR